MVSSDWFALRRARPQFGLSRRSPDSSNSESGLGSLRSPSDTTTEPRRRQGDAGIFGRDDRMAVAARALRAAPSFPRGAGASSPCSPHRHDRLTQKAHERSRLRAPQIERSIERASNAGLCFGLGLTFLLVFALAKRRATLVESISTGKPPSRGGVGAGVRRWGHLRLYSCTSSCPCLRLFSCTSRAAGEASRWPALPSSTSSATGRTRRSSTRRRKRAALLAVRNARRKGKLWSRRRRGCGGSRRI